MLQHRFEKRQLKRRMPRRKGRHANKCYRFWLAIHDMQRGTGCLAKARGRTGNAELKKILKIVHWFILRKQSKLSAAEIIVRSQFHIEHIVPGTKACKRIAPLVRQLGVFWLSAVQGQLGAARIKRNLRFERKSAAILPSSSPVQAANWLKGDPEN